MADSRVLLNVASAYKVFNLVSEQEQKVIKLINHKYSCDEICQDLGIDLDQLAELTKKTVEIYKICENCQDYSQLSQQIMDFRVA